MRFGAQTLGCPCEKSVWGALTPDLPPTKTLQAFINPKAKQSPLSEQKVLNGDYGCTDSNNWPVLAGYWEHSAQTWSRTSPREYLVLRSCTLSDLNYREPFRARLQNGMPRPRVKFSSASWGNRSQQPLRTTKNSHSIKLQLQALEKLVLWDCDKALPAVSLTHSELECSLKSLTRPQQLKWIYGVGLKPPSSSWLASEMT